MGCLNFLAIVLAISIVTVSCKIENKIEAVKRGNDFVDKVLKEIADKHGDEYDPYPLETRVVEFRTGNLIVFTGEVRLHDGSITGFSTLSRADDCLLEEKGDKLNVRASLSASDLKMQYSGTAKFRAIGLTITIHGKVDYIEVKMAMHCNANDGRDGRLDKFNLVEIRGMKVSISGLGPLNWALEVVMKAITTIFRGFLHQIVEKKLHVYFAIKINDYQFPVEGVDVDDSTKDGGEVIIPTNGEPDQTNEPEPPVEKPEQSGDKK